MANYTNHEFMIITLLYIVDEEKVGLDTFSDKNISFEARETRSQN